MLSFIHSKLQNIRSTRKPWVSPKAYRLPYRHKQKFCTLRSSKSLPCRRVNQRTDGHGTHRNCHYCSLRVHRTRGRWGEGASTKVRSTSDGGICVLVVHVINPARCGRLFTKSKLAWFWSTLGNTVAFSCHCLLCFVLSCILQSSVGTKEKEHLFKDPAAQALWQMSFSLSLSAGRFLNFPTKPWVYICIIST